MPKNELPRRIDLPSFSAYNASSAIGGGGGSTGSSSPVSHTTLTDVLPNQHHNQIHAITGADHTVTGAALDVVGLTAIDTLGVLTPSSAPGAAAAILRTSNTGALSLSDTLTVTDTTLPLRLRYDASNYADISVGSTGDLIIKLDNGAVAQYEAAVFGALTSASVAGNARGEGAVDLQSYRTAATQVARGDYATVSGGQNNTASGIFATVGGGISNTASNTSSTVSGGGANTASGIFATVGGGISNTASGLSATVSGGQNNTASGIFATVGGGISNTASNTSSTVSGGGANTASDIYATVGGGISNTASGLGATVSGGQANTASGDYSLAAGYRANTNSHNGSFVFSDRSDTSRTGFNAIAPNSVNFRATGGLNLAYDNTHRTVFTTSSTGDLTIAPTGGQVGINETTPPAGSTLAVGGDIVVTDGAGGERARIYDTGVFNSQGVYSEGMALTAGVPTTVFTLDPTDAQNIGIFTIARLDGSDHASAIVIKGDPNNQVLNIHTASGVTISLSGDDVQATATTTGSYLYGYIKLSRS